MKACCSIVIAFLLLFIMCYSAYEKKNTTIPRPICNILDFKGKNIQCSRLTPLTTPARKSAQHLLTGCDQEVSPL